MNSFTPLNYAANVSATTTVSTQSLALPGQTTKVRLTNLDSANFVKVAFSDTAGNAETAAANGVVIGPGKDAILTVPGRNGQFIAYVGDTGTVVLGITFGG